MTLRPPDWATHTRKNETVEDTSRPSLTALLSTLSTEAHIRGKQFEHICKWWLSNTPVKPFGEHTIEDIWLWDEWTDRPGPDIGIDLVARLSDGSLCAIQAKCIDESLDIPKSQLDSFISAASSRIYAYRLLIATTDGLSSNARRMLQEQHVIRVMRAELENSLSTWPATIDQLTTPIAQPTWGPRPHQQEAITNVVAGLQEHGRGQLIMACGTGKNSRMANLKSRGSASLRNYLAGFGPHRSSPHSHCSLSTVFSSPKPNH